MQIYYDAFLNESKHKVNITAKDRAGNRKTEKTWFFTVNTSEEANDVVMEVFSPLDLNYSNRRILFEINLSEEIQSLEYIDYSDKRPEFKRLCSRCQTVYKKVSFKDGVHNLSIIGLIDDEIISEKDVMFFVDSKKPKIRDTLPENKDVLNFSEFTVEYDEDFLEGINLYYRDTDQIETNAISLENCSSGKKQTCSTIVDLDDGNIEYFFEVKDRFRNIFSKTKIFTLDTTKPIIGVNSPFDDGNFNNKVLFDIEISEEVNKLEYADLNNENLRFRRLCSKCSSYNNRKILREGENDLLFRATDYAGNSDEVMISFNVVE